MGHESIAITNRYLHYLGTGADKAGLDRLNEGLSDDAGAAGGRHPRKTPPRQRRNPA